MPPLRPHPCSPSLLSSPSNPAEQTQLGTMVPTEPRNMGLDQNMRLRTQGALRLPNIRCSGASDPLFLSLGLHPCLDGIRTQGSKDVAKLSAHDRAIALLVEHAQPLHEVLIGALLLVSGDVLQDGQEGLKVQHLGIHLVQWNQQGKEFDMSSRGAEAQERCHRALPG